MAVEPPAPAPAAPSSPPQQQQQKKKKEEVQGPQSRSASRKDTSALLQKGGSSNGRIRVRKEAVEAEPSWCCISRPLSASPPGQQYSSCGGGGGTGGTTSTQQLGPGHRRLRSRSYSGELVVATYSSKSGELVYSKKSGELVTFNKKSGELAIVPLPLRRSSAGEGRSKSGELSFPLSSSSPFRRLSLSPGKVSPLVEQAMTPGYTARSAGVGVGVGVSSSPPVDKIKSSPTLFEMMTHEHELQPKAVQQPALPPLPVMPAPPPLQVLLPVMQATPLPHNRQASFLDKMASLLGSTSPGSQFNDPESSDVKLTLSNKEGYSVSVNVHRHILVTHSRFFAAKLSDRWSKQQRTLPHLVEISDCEDVELYLETLRLMYCGDVKRRLMKETVSRVLGILKVSAAIVFEAGVISCLEYLEAVPWQEDEEEKVTSLLTQLQLDRVGASEVLKRCFSTDPVVDNEDVLLKLLQSVTNSADEKARREMKALVSRMLRENSNLHKDPVDVSKESFYRACHSCLDSLLHLFMQATSPDFISKNGGDRGTLVSQIGRQADNLHWLVEILIDRRIADDFIRMWAHQSELATLHSQIPTMFRYEVSRLTARLCIAIGKGQVLCPKEVRFSLLQTWLQPLVDDFGWMQRCCKGLDKKVVEEGISQTILTLPLKQQQNILMAWFDRFSSNGDDCPNLQKAFEVWWRRRFVRPYMEAESVAQAEL